MFIKLFRFSLLFGLFASFLSCAGNQAVPAPAPSPVTNEAQYTLWSEDVLEVLVWREEELSKVVTVRPDGKISLPLAGDIHAAGLTTDQVKDKISKALADYIESPTVSVTVLETSSMKFFVQGEVNAPGPYPLQGNYSILQAIALAGGFTDWANSKKIIVYRREGNKEFTISVNYNAIISGDDPSQNIFLTRGDTIVVP